MKLLKNIIPMMLSAMIFSHRVVLLNLRKKKALCSLLAMRLADRDKRLAGEN
jgi:hypothetical protein